MPELQTRNDLYQLVSSFYRKVRRDELLGPIFNRHIADDEWPAHLEKITNFWEANLMGGQSYSGRPTQKHVEVDKNTGHAIQQEHFGRWLQLWFESIDELYDGEMANRAKEMARRMAHAQFLAIWNHR